MKKIEQTIFPLIFVLCMCGFCVFEYPQGRPRLCLTIFYILTSWLLYIYFVVYTKIITEDYFYDESWIGIFFGFALEILITFNLYHHKRFKNCLKKLDIVNSTLEEFGIPKNYTQLHARAIWMIIGWMASIIIMNSVLTVYFLVNNTKFYVIESIYVPYLVNHTTHINTLYVITFIILLGYVGSLFEHVNHIITKLIEQKKRQVRLAWATSTSSFMHRHLTDTSKSNQLICLLMHVHLELYSITRELNIIFRLRITIQMAMLHFYTIHLIIIMCENIIVKSHIEHINTINTFCAFLWTIRCSLEIFVLNDICERFYKKANRAEMFLNRLSNLTFDVESQENIMQFLLQILRKPLRVTAFGFYDYGQEFLHKFIERALKLIIIVIQAR